MMKDSSLQRLELLEDYKLQKKLTRRWSAIALLTAAYTIVYYALKYFTPKTNNAILDSLLPLLLCSVIDFGSCMILTFSIVSALIAITYGADAFLTLDKIREIEKSMRSGYY